MTGRHNGFTLVEVLVGLALTAMMATGLYSALFGVAKTARTAAAQNAGVDTRRLVQHLLRELVEDAVPFAERHGNELATLFRGERDRLRFVGHLPAHASNGGLQLVDLHAGRRESGAALELSFRNAWPDVAFDAPLDRAWTAETLVSGPAKLEVAYYGKPTENARAEWRRAWPATARLPELVKIEIEAGGERWPAIVIPLRLQASDAAPQWFREAPR